jgi:hypothetical protein
MPKGKRMKPKATGGKITKVKVGPEWTTITLRLNTKRLKHVLNDMKLSD